MDKTKLAQMNALLKLAGQNVSYPYQTNLSPDQETGFQQWVQQNHVPFDPSPQADYDMRGFYQALQNGNPIAKSSVSPVDNMIHYPDQFKTPYHQSFSNESQYASSDAPHWEGNKLVDKDGNVIHIDLPEGN